MSGSAKAGTFAERHVRDWSPEDAGVRTLPSAPGQVRVPLDKDLAGGRQTNPLVHQLYLRTIENLRAQKAAEVNRVLT